MLENRWRLYGVAVLCVIIAAALPAAVEQILGTPYPLIPFLLLSLALGLAAAVGVALTVSALRRAESGGPTADASARSDDEAQHWKEGRYRTPQDEGDDSATLMLTPEGRHASWNKGIRQLLGYERVEFLRASPADLFTPEDRAQGVPERELAEAREQGGSSAERWMVRKDGTRFPVWVSVTRVLDQQGQLVGFTKRLRDLTEAKRTEEELRRHKEALELGYEAAGLGTWDHDLNSGELILDPRARAMFALHPDGPVTYAQWEEAVHPDDLGPTKELRDAAIRDRQPFSGQFRVVWPDSTTHWIAAMGRGSYDPATGQPLCMRGILLDTTERKRTEERLQEVVRLEAIGRLAGGIAHDLNNMLVAILGFSDLLVRTFEPDDPRRDDVEQIIQAAGQSANLTQQLLAFARRELIQPRRLDLNAVVRYAAGMLRPVVGESIDLSVKLSRAMGSILADRARVEQIVMNLVLNARDAMPHGGRVTVTTEALELEEAPQDWQPEAEAPPPGRYAVLSVRDTGHGMDPATLQHIWEPFFTTKPLGRGTGLGLSVVYGSVKQSGGFVWVESEVDQGTVVRVYWPEMPVETEPSEATPLASPVERGKETVLVVEDERVVRALVVRSMTGFGYRCLEARDAEEALRRLEQEQGKVDIVITDVVMPGMSGRGLGELLAQQYPALPVLYTSGFANDDVIRRGLLDAGRPFLQKPFAPDRLARKIREVLEAGAIEHQTV